MTPLSRFGAGALALAGLFAACSGSRDQGAPGSSSGVSSAAGGASSATIGSGAGGVSSAGTGGAAAGSGGAATGSGGAGGLPTPPVMLGWSDETAARGLSGISTTCVNVSFGDLDGDGAPDLVVPGPTGVQIYRNDGQGHFGLWATLPVGSVTNGLQQCSMAIDDLDGDGKLDIAVGIDENSRPVGIYFNDGGGKFEAVFPALAPAQPFTTSFVLGVLRGTGSAPVLFDGLTLDGAASMIDGQNCGYDALGIDVQCPTNIGAPTTGAWLVNGRTLTPASDPALAFTGNVQGLGIHDFDGDGIDDAILAVDFHTQGAIRGGAAGFTDASMAWGMAQRGHGMGVAMADVDDDGITDLVLSTVGGFMEWKGLGAAGFVPRGSASVYETHRRNIYPWVLLLVDLDNNGYLDLFAANQFSSNSMMDPLQWLLTLGGPADFVGAYDTVIFRDDATTYREAQLPYDAILPHHAEGQSFAVADVDGDGRLELALPVQRDDGSRIYDLVVGKLAGLSYGHGVTVRFSGTAAPAGTVVALSCGGRRQTRTLYAAEGGGGAARREAHFGCGAAPGFDTLHVTAPGHAAVDVPAGPLDRAVTIPW